MRAIHAFVILIIILSLVPVAGVLRALPIPGENGVQPLGALFPGTPLYTEEILDGEIPDYVAWAASRSMDGENVYDMQPRKREVDIFPYPPAILFAGYALLPLAPYHYYLWAVMLLAALALTAYLANAILRDRGVARRERRVAVLLILVAQGVVRNFGWGHYAIVAIAMLLAVWYALDRDEFLSGICAGLLNSILLYGFVLVPYFVIRKKWRALALSIAVPLVSFGILGLINPASFWGFFPFTVKTGQLGLSIVGSFSLVRVLPPTASLLFLAANALVFALMTLAFWRRKVEDAHYYSYLVIFLLVTEPWFSGHHSILAIVAMVLLYSRSMLIPYAALEMNYQTFFGLATINGWVIYSIGLFAGASLLYLMILRDAWRQSVSPARPSG